MYQDTEEDKYTFEKVVFVDCAIRHQASWILDYMLKIALSPFKAGHERGDSKLVIREALSHRPW